MSGRGRRERTVPKSTPTDGAASCKAVALVFGSVTRNEKVEPMPGVEVTSILPCIRSMMRLEIARPRPVPPKRRLIESSACENSPNSLPMCSGAMPMPVSRTQHSIVAAPAFWCRQRAPISIAPVSVNLIALTARLSMTCCNRAGSPTSMGGKPGSVTARMARPFSAAFAATMLTAWSSKAAGENGIDSSSILPASSLEKSSRSLSSRSRLLLELVDGIDQMALFAVEARLEKRR